MATKEAKTIKLSPIMERFILHWGEMGTKWGINRTVAQIHALLYLSQRPLNAEEIAETLSVARSNVSNSLKELQGWRIIKIVHLYGDRRDHFESLKDVWQMFRIIIEERKRREIDPTLAAMESCVADINKSGSGADEYVKNRLLRILDFFKTISSCYEDMKDMPTEQVVKLIKLGGKIRKFIGMA